VPRRANKRQLDACGGQSPHERHQDQVLDQGLWGVSQPYAVRPFREPTAAPHDYSATASTVRSIAGGPPARGHDRVCRDVCQTCRHRGDDFAGDSDVSAASNARYRPSENASGASTNGCGIELSPARRVVHGFATGKKTPFAVRHTDDRSHRSMTHADFAISIESEQEPLDTRRLQTGRGCPWR